MQGREYDGVNCEPAWLPSGQTFVASLAVSRVPAGKHREKHGAQALRSEDTGAVPSPAFPSYMVLSGRGGPLLACCGPAAGSGGQALVTDWGLTPTRLQALVSSPQCPRERAGPRASGPWWERGRQVRPLGPALALLGGGPATSRSQDEGQSVEVVSPYKGRAGTSRGPWRLLGQHGLLHGLLQRLPRHQQTHHLLRALGEPLPGLVVCDHGHVPAVHLAQGENTAPLSSLPSGI